MEPAPDADAVETTRTTPEPPPGPARSAPTPGWCLLVVVVSSVVGLALMADQAVKASATYDEAIYLEVAARWWRTGDQAEISRMGAPLTFWKLQQAPALWLVDRLGQGRWIDDPLANQEKLLPAVRVGGSWIWLVALLIAANWARKLYGPRAMAMASVLFALGPNLLAHGGLATMETPIVACGSATFFGFWSFLNTGHRRDFWASAALGGLAMSCKFTTVLIPPILGLAWLAELRLRRSGAGSGLRGWLGGWAGDLRKVALGMAAFVLAMVLANLVVTGFATIPASTQSGDHPVLRGRISPGWEAWANRLVEASVPQDWVGFANQVIHQRSDAPSYLLGERRGDGWWYYYPVALAVKVPLAFWLLAMARTLYRTRLDRDRRGWMLLLIVGAFLAVAMIGSRRNFGVRYLLPIAPAAIVWASALAEGGWRSRSIAVVGLLGMAAAVATIHPHELTYFNELAGGPIGGRKVLSDSNLDWGQGAKALARLQRRHPEFRDVTLFYFGHTDPAYYGVEGRKFLFSAIRGPEDLPPKLSVETTFVAVSASLQWGPWGPPGYFRELDRVEPVEFTDDSTIALYRASDLTRAARLDSPPPR